jgi:hypothetical protein
MKIQYFPSQGLVHWTKKSIFKNFNIYENNIISVQAAKVLWYFIEMLEVWISEGQLSMRYSLHDISMTNHLPNKWNETIFFLHDPGQ